MKNSYLLKIATIALTLTTLSHAAHASNERGNGGDVVRCSGKLRTLDSVVLKSESLQYFNYFELTNYKDSLRMIQTKLEETLPYYGVSLRKFLETYEAKADLDSSVFWIQGKVLDIKDENLFIELPKTCGSPIQAVVLANHPITRYYYNKGLLDELAGNGDEMSWLLIHEWLRPYIKDTDTLRILNGYFHSNQFLESTENEIQMKLKRFRFECCSRATASEVKQDQADEIRYTQLLNKANAQLEEALQTNANNKLRIKKLYQTIVTLKGDLLFSYTAVDKNDEDNAAFFALIQRANELLERARHLL